MSPKRVRTHANPLAYRGPVQVPDWSAVFARPGLPWAVEWGTGKGGFLLAHAETLPEMNIVGIEIRKPLAVSLAREIAARGLANAYVHWGNIAEALPGFFPPRRIARAYALFPDPWFKRRHEKRRLLAGDFLDRLTPALAPGAEFHLASDQSALAEWMRNRLDARADFANIDGAGNYAPGRTVPFPTEWEAHAQKAARPIRWMRFRFSPEGA